jgi:hypothetical protein
MATSKFRLLGQRHRLVDCAGLGRDRVAEVRQHAVEQHADHQFVFDDEDALARGALSLTNSSIPRACRSITGRVARP